MVGLGWRRRASSSCAPDSPATADRIRPRMLSEALPPTMYAAHRESRSTSLHCAAGMSRSSALQPRRSTPRAWRWRQARHRCTCSRGGPRSHRCRSPARAASRAPTTITSPCPMRYAGSRRCGSAAGDPRRRSMRSNGPWRFRTSTCTLPRHGVSRVTRMAGVVVRAAGEDVPLRLRHRGHRLLRGLGGACRVGGLPRQGPAVARSLRAGRR